MSAQNICNDLVWDVIRNKSAYLVRRNGVDFSRNPLNVTGLHTQSEGIANGKAVGLNASAEGIVVSVKKNNKGNRPASSIQSYTISKSTPRQKVRRSVQNAASKQRPDLHERILARADALVAGQKPVKAERPEKLRGAKAAAATQA